MCFGCIHFRVLHARLKQKIYPKPLNMQQIIRIFQSLFNFLEAQIGLSFQNNWTRALFVIGMPYFSRFYFS